MKATIDALGRLVVPKPLRDALGLTPGTVVDVSRYGPGLSLIPEGRTARIVESDGGGLVAESSTAVTDEVVFDLLDAARR
ncbi:MAG: AbrB/MazE/SpoVT family DNA-binding domain-containing protein [Actinomycetota bacterium]|nr:AbrB/MazE/SpoVT family DNA-binding domain-containing protein [Actinomycetota bacterium]